MNMKTYSKLTLMAIAAASMLSVTGCKDEEVYDTLVTREYNLYLDGESFYNKTEDSHVYGDWNVYVYHTDGRSQGNYKTQYRFSLESGNYKVLSVHSTTVSRFFEPDTKLEDVIIPQDEAMSTVFAASDVVDYKAGDALNVYMTTRTGLLRLRAADEKADKSYNRLRATLKTPVKAYHCADGKPVVDGEALTLSREKETTGGGIGYAEDMVLIGSDEKIDITIDYLDNDGNVVNSKSFADGIKVAPNDTTTVSFNLNDPSEQVIINYTVEVGSSSWGNESQYPSVPVEVPDGYVYVKPDENLDAAFNEQANDASVDVIKLFLKANSAYTLAESTMATVTKPFVILGQTPGYGQTQAQLTLGGAIAMRGNLSVMRFENLDIKGASRFFNIRNNEFNVGEVAFVDCTMDSWNGNLWYQVTSADNQQVVGTMRLEGCRFLNHTAAAQPLIYLPTNRVAPISNFVIKNNVFQEKSYTTRTVILSRMTKLNGNVTVDVEGNTFIATNNTEFTYFDIDGKACNLTLNVKDNVLTGSKSGAGTWFKLGKTSAVNCSGNTRSAAYEMKNWGVDAPAATAPSYEDILKQLNL